MFAILGVFFAFAVLGSFLALCVVAAHDVPLIAGTAAFILTLAALGVAILH
ncbi:hypothetical protein ABZ070_10220 [Streptomyces sp. NPDC006283]|uniref:hypothetical protein n=1 Tax=Streptomyces sp. NPDC006283 TaxID=3156741 RepID=UPI0033AD4D9D